MIKELEKALSRVLLFFPCLGYFIYSWKVEETEEISTLGTNYEKLLYNPNYCKQITTDQLAAVVIHECVHNMFLHPTKVTQKQAQGKVYDLWIIALEMVTNAEVIKIIKSANTNFELPGKPYSPLSDDEPPEGDIYYYDANCRNLTVTEIYEKLYEKYKDKIIVIHGDFPLNPKGGSQQDESGGSQDNGDNGSEGIMGEQTCPRCGSKVPKNAKECPKCGAKVIDLPSTLDKVLPSDDKAKVQETIEKTIAVVEKLKKQIGDTPLGIERFVKRYLQSQVPWTRILLSFIGNIVSGSEEYRWEKPNHRHPLSSEVIMPGLVDIELDDIVFVVDTSGSMSDSQISQIVSELGKVAQYVSEVVIYTTDAKVQEKVRVRNAGEIFRKLKFKGGGGTDFRPIFEEVKRCACMVFFTDGYATYPEKPPRYPVLWVLTKDNETPPFGKVCFVFDEKDE
jgi:predicted metal-dependent peptidase